MKSFNGMSLLGYSLLSLAAVIALSACNAATETKKAPGAAATAPTSVYTATTLATALGTSTATGSTTTTSSGTVTFTSTATSSATATSTTATSTKTATQTQTQTQTATQTATSTLTEGTVNLGRIHGPDMDRYTTNATNATKQSLQQTFERMMVYSNYFDDKLSWYPNAWAYFDLYAIYKDADQPQWALKDKNGKRLYINWGCGNGSCPQYAADIGNPDYRRWWIETAKKLARTYKGLYIDDVNMTWSISDNNAVARAPMNPRTGREMTLAEWRAYMADFLEEIRAAVPGVEITHNAVWFHDGENNYSDPAIKRQIRAANYYNIEHGVNDDGLTGGTGRWSLDKMLQFIDFIHEQGTNIVLDGITSGSGGRDYTLGNYLLVSNGRDILFDENINPDSRWPGYDVNLGRALGKRYRWNGLYRRDFEKGMVLVNEPGAGTVVVSAAGYKDALTGASATFTLKAKSAKILKK